MSKLQSHIITIPFYSIERPSRSGVCISGNITIPVGRVIPQKNCETKCSCLTPPDVTCVQYSSCENIPLKTGKIIG